MRKLDAGYTKAPFIVWTGKSPYWTYVWLKEGKLYIKVAPYDYRPLEDYKIRKMEQL